MPPALTLREPMTTKYQGLTSAQRQHQYQEDRKLIRQAKKTQISFMGCDLKIRMGVTVLGGCTGKGKSTCSANILADFYTRYPDRQALVISNEETSADVLDRIACVLNKTDFYKYRDGGTPPAYEEMIEKCSGQLLKRVEVVCNEGIDMTCLEDVIDVLRYAKTQEHLKLVVLDYLQTVTWSKRFPLITAYEVSKKLGLFLKEYGKTANVPVIVFAQLKPAPESEGEWRPDMADRVQGDRTFVNHAVMTIEIIPDFEESSTSFYIHKDRFGSTAGNSHNFDWKQGRLIEQRVF